MSAECQAKIPKFPESRDFSRHRLIQDYLSWEIILNTPESVLQALEIEVRHKISFWDALIVHAKELSGAVVLYSEDRAHGQKFGPIQVINPLLDHAKLET